MEINYSNTSNKPKALVYLGFPQSPVNAKTPDTVKPQTVTLPNLIQQLGQPWQLQQFLIEQGTVKEET